MTKSERTAIAHALKCLDSAFDPKTFEYSAAAVMNAHRTLRGIDLSPPKPRAKTQEADANG